MYSPCSVIPYTWVAVSPHRTASRARRPTLTPDSRTTPASPSVSAASRAVTNTDTSTWGASAPMHSSTRAVAFFHPADNNLFSPGTSGSWSASSVSVLSMTSPAYASTPPHNRHDESSKEGCNTKNRSSTDRSSSAAVNLALRAASRNKPATSQSRPRPRSSGIRDKASTRRNDTPSDSAPRRSGRSAVRRINRTRPRASSRVVSNTNPTHPQRPPPIARVDLTPVQLLHDLELHRSEPGPLLLSRNQEPLEIVSRCPLPSHNTNIRPPCDRFRRRRKL